MERKTKSISLLVVLVVLLIVINYSLINKTLEGFLIENEGGVVERVIDGDTIIVNNVSVRLLGINSPERGENYYLEAKDFLENLVLNKNVRFEFSGKKYDQYNRILAYIFIDEKNVNLKMVEEGFANVYFPSGKSGYYNSFNLEWEECVKENKNLCRMSTGKCADCIYLEEFDYKNEIVGFYNKCDFDCELTGWEIKDEGRKNFVFQDFVLESNKEVKVVIGEGINSNEKLFWKNEDYVWTDSGDTLFLRDNKGKLVLWERY